MLWPLPKCLHPAETDRLLFGEVLRRIWMLLCFPGLTKTNVLKDAAVNTPLKNYKGWLTLRSHFLRLQLPGFLGSPLLCLCLLGRTKNNHEYKGGGGGADSRNNQILKYLLLESKRMTLFGVKRWQALATVKSCLIQKGLKGFFNCFILLFEV